MAEFVREHAFEFLIVEQIQNALGYGDRRMLRIAPGSEGVRRLGRNHVQLRHRQAGLLRQAFDDLVDARQSARG